MTTDTVLDIKIINDIARDMFGTMASHQENQFARAIEQAVLQSPEVQRLREGWATVPVYPTNEMVRAMFGQPDETGFYHFYGDFGNIAYQFVRLIDAAMEKQP